MIHNNFVFKFDIYNGYISTIFIFYKTFKLIYINILLLLKYVRI